MILPTSSQNNARLWLPGKVSVVNEWVYEGGGAAFNAAARTWASEDFTVTLTYNDATQTYNGKNSLKVVINSAWGMIQRNSSASVDYSLYTKFSYYVYNTTTANMRTYLTKDGGGAGTDRSTAVTQNVWTKVEYTWAANNINGNVDKFNIGFFAATTGTFYLNEIQFE